MNYIKTRLAALCGTNSLICNVDRIVIFEDYIIINKLLF